MRHSAIYAIGRKELIRLRRDRRTLAVMVLYPLFMLLLYGFGIRYDVTAVTLAVLDYDRSQESRAFMERLLTGEYFVRSAEAGSYEDLRSLLDKGRARIGVVIPPEFGRKIKLQERVAVQALVDGTDNNTASIALGYFTAIAQTYSVEIIQDRLRRLSYPPPFEVPALKAESRIWYNPDLRSSHYIVPGLIALIMMLVGAIMTAITIVQEKESGSIEQLIVSPVRPLELVVGKLVPYILFSTFDLLLVVTMAYLVFGVSIRGSFALLFCTALLYLTVVLGLGVVVSTLTETVQSAMLLAFLISMLPSILLSGFVFPIESMPPILQGLSFFVPARYFLEIIRAIYLKGTGLAQFWPQVLYLAAFAAALLFISTVRFKKRLD